MLVEENLAMEKKSKVTPTFLLVFFACLLTVPTVYFARKGYATHRAAVSAGTGSNVESFPGKSIHNELMEGYGAA